MKLDTINKNKKFQMISKWEKSGMCVKDFCLKENIMRQSFYYWLKLYNKSKKPPISNFIKLPNPQLFQDTQKQMEVVFINGTRISFYYAVDIQTLKQLAV